MSRATCKRWRVLPGVIDAHMTRSITVDFSESVGGILQAQGEQPNSQVSPGYYPTQPSISEGCHPASPITVLQQKSIGALVLVVHFEAQVERLPYLQAT